MKLYLSSYKLGDKTEFLKSHIEEYGNKIAYIANALDFTNPNIERRNETISSDIKNLSEVGFDVEVLDLKDYFSDFSNGASKGATKLKSKLAAISAIWVSGGNTFILRQAMKLSGLDEIIINDLSTRTDFLYAGYSAGICVLSPDLIHLQTVDNPDERPYKENTEIIWEGLNIIDFAILPHYDSDHPESAEIDKEIKFCIENKILFLALRDGEVIIKDEEES